MTDERPDPDRLLEQIRQEEAAVARGKLKIFFGACAGVGKTFAMLQAARQKYAEGVEVLIGIVETHGRSETAELLKDLPILPSRRLEYRGRLLAEFDLDAALALRPKLLLVDELAHSNVEGSRHAKRWQDVEELIEAGIDVYTALNVQHLESLNDIIGGITGVKVWETVPDRVFDIADEVSLVDLPPDELLLRLSAGKVYIPEQAERAAKNFFRKGNLIALRELALRRTADRVDAQMRAYRADRAITHVWQAKERLIVCIGPDPGAEKLVRAAARLAAKLQADWIAVYVETPKLQRLSRERRHRIAVALKLAEEMGAESTTLSGVSISGTLIAYAKSRNAGKLVIGRPTKSKWQLFFRPGVAGELAARPSELEVYWIGMEKSREKPLPEIHSKAIPWTDYFLTTLLCFATTGIAATLLRVFEPANVVMVHLLSVVLASLRYGRGPGAWAACLSVFCFDYFFVPPHFSFKVEDAQYLFTFAMMLAVALIIGQLAAGLRFEARVARSRERRASAQAELARELGGALVASQIVQTAERHLSAMFEAEVALLLPDSLELIRTAGKPTLAQVDLDVAQWVYDHQQPAGHGTGTLPATPGRYLPLKAPMRTRGVLAIHTRSRDLLDRSEVLRLLDAFCSQIALALERVHYVEVAQDALVTMESERLRNSLLSAVSHDLRTPLTALIGLASTLAEKDPAQPTRRELAVTILETARKMNDLVTNLLEMARLQSGVVKLNKDWQSVEEVVGSVLRQLAPVVAHHRIEIALPPQLPLCEFDPVLIERVFANLIDNAVKYTPPGTTITLAAAASSDTLSIMVEDDGPGLPPGQEEKLFDKFVRGTSESSTLGVGLGLAVCRAIVAAHGGRIWAERREGGGARFVFTLPLGSLPKSQPNAEEES